MSYECQCPIAGFCARHQTRKSQRDWELCQGVNCDPEVSAKYQDFWDNRVSGDVAATTTRERVATEATVKVYEPVPYEEWPAAAKLIAQLATPEDTGVGDTIKRQLGIAGKLYQAAFRLLTGGTCVGCGFRQRKWNQLYPYRTT